MDGEPARAQLRAVVVAQVLAGAASGAIASAIDASAGASALLGGLAAAVPGAYFARRVLAARTGQGLEGLLRAETGKLVMVAAVLVAGYAALGSVNLPALVLAMVAVQAAGAIAAGGALRGRKRSREAGATREPEHG